MKPLALFSVLGAALAAILSGVGAFNAAREFGFGATSFLAGAICALVFASVAVALFISMQRGRP